MDTDDTGDPPAPKKRGRPKGSVNRKRKIADLRDLETERLRLHHKAVPPEMAAAEWIAEVKGRAVAHVIQVLATTSTPDAVIVDDLWHRFKLNWRLAADLIDECKRRIRMAGASQEAMSERARVDAAISIFSSSMSYERSIAKMVDIYGCTREQASAAISEARTALRASLTNSDVNEHRAAQLNRLLEGAEGALNRGDASGQASLERCISQIIGTDMPVRTEITVTTGTDEGAELLQRFLGSMGKVGGGETYKAIALEEVNADGETVVPPTPPEPVDPDCPACGKKPCLCDPVDPEEDTPVADTDPDQTMPWEEDDEHAPSNAPAPPEEPEA